MKPLGHKAYGSIGHLPGSRMGAGDHHVTEGQARICTERTRDKHDAVFVQEKLDGSNVCAARIDGKILALTRAGYLATTSPYEQHHLWAAWVRENEGRFYDVLTDGERLCGEWLAQAHGTRYQLYHEPFVAFDLMRGHERVIVAELVERMIPGGFKIPALLNAGEAFSIEEALDELGPHGWHGALDRPEGAVWRVERQGKVDFLAKYVRPDKVDGSYLPEKHGGGEPVWNWRPSRAVAA